MLRTGSASDRRAEHPADFLRGLFHSDGRRVANWATRMVAGERKRYDYPRWQFATAPTTSCDLRCAALDLVGIAWTGPRHDARCSACDARLDELLGRKPALGSRMTGSTAASARQRR